MVTLRKLNYFKPFYGMSLWEMPCEGWLSTRICDNLIHLNMFVETLPVALSCCPELTKSIRPRVMNNLENLTPENIEAPLQKLA